MGELLAVVHKLVVDDRYFFEILDLYVGDYFVAAAAVPVVIYQVVLLYIHSVNKRCIGGKQITAVIGLRKKFAEIG